MTGREVKWFNKFNVEGTYLGVIPNECHPMPWIYWRGTKVTRSYSHLDTTPIDNYCLLLYFASFSPALPFQSFPLLSFAEISRACNEVLTHTHNRPGHWR